MLAIAPAEHDWSGHRVTISAPQFGRLVDIHLSHTRVKWRKVESTILMRCRTIRLANDAGPRPVDFPSWRSREDSNLHFQLRYSA